MVNSKLSNCKFVDTHCHLDGEEFKDDREVVVQRAREAGCTGIFLPAIDVATCQTVLDTCAQYPDFCYPMLGLHPEEVRTDWRDQLVQIKSFLISHFSFLLAKSVWTTTGVVSLNRNSCWPLRSRYVGRWNCSCP